MTSSVNLDSLRCSASQLLQAAVLELFPDTLLVGGNKDSIGFYYDFLFPFEFQDAFLILVEEKMREMVKRAFPIRILEMIPQNASDFLIHRGQPHRAKCVSESGEVLAGLVQIDKFIDFSSGPHLTNTQEITAFSLKKASCYCSEKGKVTRIWGATFNDKSDLKKFFKKLESYRESNHLILGREMDLFSRCEQGEGVFFRWHPKGEILRKILLNYWEWQIEEEKFQRINTPQKNHVENPWQEKTREHISYWSIDKKQNKVAECNYFFNPIERGDEEAGMFTARGIHVDLNHVFCEEKDLLNECISSLQFISKFSKLFSFKSRWVLSSAVQGAKAARSLWEKRQETLKQALDKCAISYELDERIEAISGPEVQNWIEDGLGREWKGPSLRLEVLLTEEFSMKGKGLLVYSLFYSLERFVALLLEQTVGLLPFWLAPCQVQILILDAASKQWGESIAHKWRAGGLRVEVDFKQTRLNQQMHEVLRGRVPYVIVIGEKERRTQKLSMRSYGTKINEYLSSEECFEKLLKLKKESEIENK